MFKKESLLDFDQDIVLPFTNEWKKTYNFAIKKIEERNKNAQQLKLELDNILNIIIKDGEAYEDIVLKATVLYFITKNNIVDINYIKQNYSSTILDIIQLLLKDNDNNSLNKIFLSKEYAYLNKIKLTEMIALLNDAQNKKIVDKIKVLTQVDTIIKNYKTKTHKKLMNILIETRNKIN